MPWCKECQEFHTILEQAPIIGFTRDLSVVEAAADGGCELCAIYAAIYHHFVEAGLIPQGSVVPVYISALAFFGRPSMLSGIPDYEGPCIPFLLRREEEVEAFLQYDVPTVEGTSTASDESLECAKQWMQLCQDTHTSCQLRAGGYYRPTRLLRLFPGEVRLCENDEIDLPADNVAYATLSHSWGSLLPLTLTGARLNSFKKGILLSDLPKTFQEAVEVAMKFGLEYIWIDCLCIIQDSVDDWAKESVMMASIYGNSTLNIAATASRDGRGGCFRTRRTRALRPVKITLQETPFYLIDAEMWWEAFEKAPLNKRAWVLQERLLSPRVLHFDHDQLVWECNELTASERYPKGLRKGLIPAPRFLRNRLDDLLQSKEELLPGQELYHAWKPIVSAYSACGLTKTSDKLIALHGVASRVQEILGGNYAAGLFSDNIESQLLWKVLDNKTSTLPEEHVAPSWSWASIVGPVSLLPQWDFLDTRGEEFTRQFSAEQLKEISVCRVRNKDLLGTRETTSMISHEKLEIECYLVPIYYVAMSETADWKSTKYQPRIRYTVDDFMNDVDVESVPRAAEVWPMALSSWSRSITEGEVWDVVPFEGDTELSVLVSTAKGDEENSFGVRLEHDVRADALTRNTRWLLPVYSVTEWSALDVFSQTQYRSLNGLVVERVGSEGSTFKRCGTFKLRSELNWKGPERFWSNAMKFDAVEGIEPEICDNVGFPVLFEPTSEEESRGFKYEHRDGVKQYVVSII
ncbi:heterokaryon incompatibility protein-domain-containing protein [Podospora australis]|uniref:Heterokaryon incompatibility protein-domain-containing protein n=1 Tax=Podospora australis TaxID=1536484 RepID=A0AAN7ADK2_9PEZI|nr:heterokaryon incompatibility protein-domain-containing protein [Podospora australis]